MLPPGFSVALIRIQLVRFGDTWFIKEVKYDDLDYKMVAETMGPALLALQAKQKGLSPGQVLASPALRILQSRQQDAKLALKVAEQAVTDDPEESDSSFSEGRLSARSRRGERPGSDRLIDPNTD